MIIGAIQKDFPQIPQYKLGYDLVFMLAPLSVSYT